MRIRKSKDRTTQWSILLLHYVSDFVCPDDSVKCKDNIQCIRSFNLCDTYKDCNDNSDEDEELCRGTIIEISIRVGTDCIGSHKSNYHMITTTMVPQY
jgi:hypothetical protein